MAVVTILLSCALASVAAIIHFALLGASLGQAFLTYVVVAVVLSATVLGIATFIAMFRTTEGASGSAQGQDLETWQDWETEEAIEADRLRFQAERSLRGGAETHRGDTSAIMAVTPRTSATAYSVRKAGMG